MWCRAGIHLCALFGGREIIDDVNTRLRRYLNRWTPNGACRDDEGGGRYEHLISPRAGWVSIGRRQREIETLPRARGRRKTRVV